MKINMPCSECGAYNQIDLIEKTNFKYSCRNGHEYTAKLTMPVYPLFFQYGLTTYIDHYYFESFMSIYKSYETFIRDFVKAALFDRTVQVSEQGPYPLRTIFPDKAQEIDEMMKQNYRQSTQLMTAFITLYFTRYGERPPKFEGNVNHRNLFVHSDKIITKNDCENLAMQVKKFIRPIELKLANEQDFFLNNYFTGEWMLSSENTSGKVKSLQTQKLVLGLGSLDTDYDFESILDKAITYSHRK